MPVKNRFSELLPEITGWRRDIHENPELLFDTHRTSSFVEESLKEFGCDDVTAGVGRTGVIGVIKGQTNKSGKVIGLRADMDALPIFEATGLDYKSKTPGVMHACGHDGHTAMLLGAAKYLSETRNFDGTVVLIFQPAEEGGGGGREMCEDGMMDRWGVDEVYGMHNWPGAPAGSFSIRSGPFFAATDTFEINLKGRGGHAAKPQETIDTTVLASHLVIALQTIASRNADPTDQIVVSITSIESESKAFNVIPEHVTLKGTIRTMSVEMRDLAEKRLKEISTSVSQTFGGSCEVNFRPGYPVMENHKEQTDFAASIATSVTGSCDEAPLVMGGEDFSYMLNERPGAYILVGNGDTAACHHPAYNFSDDIIPSGCSYWAELIEKRLPR